MFLQQIIIGLRKVYPYYFTFTTFTKGRWVGEKILEVFGREFRAHPVEEYVSNNCIQIIRILISTRPVFTISFKYFLFRFSTFVGKVHNGWYFDCELRASRCRLPTASQWSTGQYSPQVRNICSVWLQSFSRKRLSPKKILYYLTPIAI